MNIIATLVTALSSHTGIAVAIALVLIFWFILHNQLELQEKIYDIKKVYRSRTSTHIYDVLHGILMTSFDRMMDKIDEHKIHDKGIETEQERMIYFLTLQVVFLIHIKQLVENAIDKNGYCELDDKDLKDYCTSKGSRLYEEVIVKLKVNAKLTPNISPFIGDNFKVEEAIECFQEIIFNSLENNKNRDKKIAKAKKENMVVIGKLFKLFSK
jgi:hypothetical protein